MNNQANKYPYLKNKTANITRPFYDTLRPRSPINNACYLTCNNSPHRQSSPNSHLKTKIRLVSPQKNINAISFIPKQNSPPVEILKSQKYREGIKSPREMELSGRRPELISYVPKVQLNEASNISIVRHFQKQGKAPSPLHGNFKKGLPYYVAGSPSHQLGESLRPISPQKIVINNKRFDLGNIKSQIIYVNPMSHKRGFSDQVNMMQIRRRADPVQSTTYECHESANANTLPTDLVIQEQNNLEELKQSYLEEIKQIKGLQSEIQQNNIQIKELLHHSRASKHTHSNRTIEEQQFLDGIEMVSTINGDRSQPNFYTHHSQNIQKLSERNMTNQQELQIGQINIKPKMVGERKNAVPGCSQETIINELNFVTAKRIQSKHQSQYSKAEKDSVSVQAEIDSNTVEPKINRLVLTRNEQCCIQMLIKAGPPVLQKEQPVIIPSLKKIDCSQNKTDKGLNLCSQPSLVYLFKTQEKIAQAEVEPVLSNQAAPEMTDKVSNKIISVSQSIKSVHYTIQEAKDLLPIQNNSSQKKASQISIGSVKSKESKAGSIVTQKIETKAEKKEIISQEEVVSIENIIKSKMTEAHLNTAEKLLQKNKASPLQYSAPPVQKIQIGRSLLQGPPAPTPSSRRKFNNRIYL